MKTRTPYAKLLHLFLLFFSLTVSQSLFSQILLQSSFEGTNPFAGFTNNQSCCSYSVTASTNHPHDGNQSFRSEVRQGDPAVSSGWRAELTTSNISDQGDMWYGFSVYFETPVSNGNWTGSYGGHFIQWHPDNGSGSAELAIWGSDGLWDVCVNPSGSGSVTHQTQTASGGALKRITANVWHDVVFHVKWGTAGMVEVWIDGEFYFTKSNLNWLANAYLKLGMNRWGNCNSGAPCDTWVIYYDNIKIGRGVTYNDVAPNATTPPVNQPPVANAGNNISVTLPATTATLNGTGSTDPNGNNTIVSYAWSKVSPATSAVTIVSPNSATSQLTGLTQGTHVFRLTVTDAGGLSSTDDVTVTVNPAPNQSPTANAGSDITITLPTTSASLIGSGMDPDGTIASYVWSKVNVQAGTNPSFTTPNQASTTVNGLTVAGIYTFRLTVTDNNGATATDNVTVTVIAAPNLPPSANAGNNIVITLPTNSTNLGGSGTDPDGTIVSYVWTKVSSNPANATATIGSPNTANSPLSNLQQGTYTFRLTVTDNSGATATDDVTVTVNAAPNQSPIVDAGNNIVITLPTNSVTLTGVASDPDGTIVSYLWTRVAPTTPSATIVTPNNFSTQITGLTQGTYTFRLTVTDNSGISATDNVTVTVNAAPNQPPSANAGNNIVITLPTNSTNLGGSGTDPDGTIVSYAWTKISSNPANATATIGSPNTANSPLSNLQQGTYTFRLTVTDNSGATATDDVNVTVNAAPPVNQLPIANAGNNIVLTLPTNNTTLNGSGSTDPDGTIGTYAWTKVSSNPATATSTIGSPGTANTPLSNLQQGTYIFKLTVTDNNGAQDSDSVMVTVNAAPNQSPIVNAGNNITLTLPANSTTLNGTASDPDGTIVSHAWTKVSSNPANATSTIGSPNTVSTPLSNLQQGTYVFRLTVTDNSGVTSSDDVTVIVNGVPNTPPIANAGNNIVLTLPTNSTTLNGSASVDPNGTIVSYVWTKISSNPANATATIGSPNSANTPLNNLQQGTYILTLTVTDNNGASNSDNVMVTVNPPAPAVNQAPVVNAGSDIIMMLPANTAQLTGSASDPDGTIASYTWTQISGTAAGVVLSNPSSSSTGLTIQTAGTYVFRLTARDNNGATSFDNVTVVVYPATAGNQPPVARTNNDITITLPVNSAQLFGNSSSDLDGVIVSYQWTLVSGPSQATIASGTASNTMVSNLTTGIYTFQLKVTDDDGATSVKTVKVTVQNQVDAPAAYIKIYPNPAEGNLIMQYIANVNGKFRITIYDVNRKLIMNETFDKTQVSITKQFDVSRLKQGVYIIQVISPDKTKVTLQFVKMK